MEIIFFFFFLFKRMRFSYLFVWFILQKEIKSSLPSANPTAALQDSNVVQELRKLMEQVETIKAEREVIEREIKDATFDMSEWWN